MSNITSQLDADDLENCFDPDDDDWYIMKTAYENGANPYEVLRNVRVKQFGLLAPQSPKTNGEEQQRGVWSDLLAAPSMQWPPGRAGRIARFIYARSYSPVIEVSVTATLGLLAGVCGRAYRTYTGKDLALYIILVARSGIGKDSAHDSIPELLKLSGVRGAERFVRAQDFVSGEALHKEILRDPGFLALQGEFGRKLKRMSNPTDTPMQNLRTVMTNAYGKQFLEGKSYSNVDNSLEGVEWPALSFLGETTPGTFLECLTPDMMADGFLSRFLCVTYQGERPFPNRVRDILLPDGDRKAWRDLVALMIDRQNQGNVPARIVKPNDDAREKLEGFELECIDELNRAGDDEPMRQVWNRAHLKALKVASLLAVADQSVNPIVRLEHVAWALMLVRRDESIFQEHKSNGDIGMSDDTREHKLLSFIKEYLGGPVSAGYKVPTGMREQGIVTRAFLQIRASSLPAFNNHRLGKSRALDEALRSLESSGYLVGVKQDKLIDSFGFHGKAYRIVRLP